MRYFFFVLLCTSMLSLSAQDKAPKQDEFATALYQYLELSGAKQQFDVVIDQMIGLQQGAYPAVPEEFWTEFQSRIRQIGFDDLAERMVPVYRNHFTQEELDALVSFYGSEIGRSIASKTALVTQESMQIGAEWGAAIGGEIVRELQEAVEAGEIQRH